MNLLVLTILFYFVYSFIGWIIEVIYVGIDSKEFINRGFLIGPVCPIYGACSLFMLVTLRYFKDTPLLLFCMAIIICSVIEYLTSYVMEKLFGARWWDYSDKPFHLHGRIYLINSLLFGILGYFLLYYVHPFLLQLINIIPITIIYGVVIIFSLIFIIDCIISFNVILKIKKVTAFVKKDNTKEISEKVREILKNTSFLGKRLLSAFPDFRVIIKDIGFKVEKQINKISNRGVK